jgi:hypothetical protein
LKTAALGVAVEWAINALPSNEVEEFPMAINKSCFDVTVWEKFSDLSETTGDELKKGS